LQTAQIRGSWLEADALVEHVSLNGDHHVGWPVGNAELLGHCGKVLDIDPDRDEIGLQGSGHVQSREHVAVHSGTGLATVCPKMDKDQAIGLCSKSPRRVEINLPADCLLGQSRRGHRRTEDQREKEPECRPHDLDPQRPQRKSLEAADAGSVLSISVKEARHIGEN
jgi:hypothetical protein